MKPAPGFKSSFVFLAVAAQVICSILFIGNFIVSVLGLRSSGLHWRVMEALELSAAIGLVIGGILSLRIMRLAIKEVRSVRQSLRLAGGAFEEVIEQRLNDWELSEAERDVAWFSIKGFDTKDIAELRGSRIGTVKAQLAAIYRKTGVNSRTQFITLLIDDLLIEVKPELSKP